MRFGPQQIWTGQQGQPPAAVHDTVRTDVGNVFDTKGLVSDPDTGFKFSELRYSVGVSTTWLSPIGALSVSLGFPLNDKDGDEVERFQFSFGTGF